MKTLVTAAVAGLAIALAACTKEEARDAGNDVEAAADKVAQETREAASSPEVKEVGSEIKEAAGDVGQVIKGAAKGAAEGGREAAAKVEGEAKDDHQEPARK
jgi:predicted small secreted protein